MRYLCRYCRQEVQPTTVACGRCGAELDGRSRLPVAAVDPFLGPEMGGGAPPATPATTTTPGPPVSDWPVPPRPASTVPPQTVPAPSSAAGTAPATAVGPPDATSPFAASTAQPSPSQPAEPVPGSALAARSRPRPAEANVFEPVKPTRPDDGAPPGPPTAWAVGGDTDPLPELPILPAGAMARGRYCPNPGCGAANDEGRRFCARCLQPLDPDPGTAGRRAVTVRRRRIPWYRRLLGYRHPAAGRHPLDRRARDQRLKRRLKGRLGMATRARVAVGAGGLALLVALGLALGPLRRPLVRAIDPPSEKVPYTAALLAGEVPDPAFGVAQLNDESEQSGLRLAWNQAAATPVVSDRCEPAGPAGLMLTFEGQTPAVARLYVGSAPVDEKEAPDLRPGPRRVRVRGAGGCRTVELGTTQGWATVEVSDLVADGAWIEVWILERVEHPATTTYPVLAIAEIQLLR